MVKSEEKKIRPTSFFTPVIHFLMWYHKISPETFLLTHKAAAKISCSQHNKPSDLLTYFKNKLDIYPFHGSVYLGFWKIQLNY